MALKFKEYIIAIKNDSSLHFTCFVINKTFFCSGQIYRTFSSFSFVLAATNCECILCTGKNDAGPNGSYRLEHHTCGEIEDDDIGGVGTISQMHKCVILS